MRTLITGGRLIDPANRTDAKLDLLLEDGRIAFAAPSVSADADEVIDASDRIVCPGFIDIHMHEDALTQADTIDPVIFGCMARMGVTTVLAGNCGDNACAPWHYFDLCDAGVPVNVAMLAGHTWARHAAGANDRYAAATEEQKKVIEKLLRESLDAGCAGVSFGVRYVPGTNAEEIDRAASVCRRTGKFIAAHVRDDATMIFGSISEMLNAAEKHDLALQISHIGSMAGFGQMEGVLSMLDACRLNGRDVTCDCYPYDAFCTELGATTYDDGWTARYGCGYDVLEYCSGPLAGQRADERSFARLRAQLPDMLTVCHVMRPEEIALAMRHPAVMIGSDGILDCGSGHPRAAGTFPRVFAEYVRRGHLTLSEAIAKMTLMPARCLGLKHKGNLSVGSDADIVIFDPETVADRATFASPTLPPIGIDRVMIGGRTAVKDGTLIDSTLGRSVRL